MKISSQAKKILVVDDDIVILGLLKFKLHRLGYEVITARNNKEFWDMAFEEKPDLIILDVWLKNKLGTDVYDQLLAFGFDKHVPVIFITALLDTPRARYGSRDGRFALFSKPFNFEDLLGEIHRLLSSDRDGDEETAPLSRWVFDAAEQSFYDDQNES